MSKWLHYSTSVRNQTEGWEPVGAKVHWLVSYWAIRNFEGYCEGNWVLLVGERLVVDGRQLGKVAGTTDGEILGTWLGTHDGRVVGDVLGVAVGTTVGT